MTATRAFIKKHPVLSYYALVFAISWGGILLVVGPDGFPATGEQSDRLFPFVLVALFAGPSVAGILLTGLIYGRVGFRNLLARMTRWRVGARWYAVALLTAPLLVMATLLVFSMTSPEFLPRIFTSNEKASLLLFGLAWGLVGGGILEELGWSGFAVPRLRLRYDALTTGLIVGILWGAWHFLVAFWGSGTPSGELSLAVFLPAVLFYVGSLPAYRVLMVWVYDRTGSLLVTMLMHASFSASMLILQPLELDLVAGLSWNLLLAATLWAVVAAVAIPKGLRLSAPEASGLRRLLQARASAGR
jgi:hypothetical protein